MITSNNFGFLCARWGNLMAFSGNYIYNTTQGSWWLLYPRTGNGSATVVGKSFFWWVGGAFGYQFYASPLRITTPVAPWLYRFDNRFDAPHWQWESLPIHVAPTANHVVEVREIVVRASCGSPGSTVKVTIGSFTATSAATAIGTSPPRSASMSAQVRSG